MSKGLSVHVIYKNDTQIINCSRLEFLSKVSQRFQIEEDDIEIYDRKSKRRIDVGSISDLVRLEIKRKNSDADMASNNGASTSRKTPCHEEIIRKLTENSALTGIERGYLVELLSNVGTTGRTTESTGMNNKKMKHIKIQVNSENLIPVRSIGVETDKVVTPSPSKRNLDSNEIMLKSKRLASSEKIDTNKAKELNDKLYNERRSFILVQTPLASFVKEKYPLLFTLAEVRNEIDRILHHGKCEEFLNNIVKYAKPILSMVREDDPLLITTQKKVQTFPTKAQQRYARQVGSLLMISSLMNEDRGYLSLIDQPIQKSLFPYIEAQAKFSEIFFDEHLFRVYVEGILLCEASDFKEAILCLIGSYYIFNIKYQDEISSTFTAFEQLYLERRDTDDLDECVEQIIGTIRVKAPAIQYNSLKV